MLLKYKLALKGPIIANFSTLKGLDRSCIQSALLAYLTVTIRLCPEELLAFFSLALIQDIENSSGGIWIYFIEKKHPQSTSRMFSPPPTSH